MAALLLSAAVAAAVNESGVGRREDCPVAIIGGGWSGAYFAWRIAVDTATVPASEVCVFEATERTGGRIYSIPDAPGAFGLTIDVGGYRTQTGMRLPRDLIEKGLNMSTAPYSPRGADQRMLVVADPFGNNAGFGTPIDRMLNDLKEKGGRVFMYHQLTSVTRGPDNTMDLSLLATNKLFPSQRRVAINARLAFLNVPSAPSLINLGNSSLPWSEADSLTYSALSAPTPNAQCKAYLSYKDAWWITKLGRDEGTFSDTSDSVNRPALAGRYHDGPVLCADPRRRGESCGNSTDPLCRQGRWMSSRRLGRGEECSGSLLVAYTTGTSNCAYYHALQSDLSSPYVAIYGSSHPQRAALLAAHQRVIDFHRSALLAADVDPDSIEEPESLLLGIWKEEAPFKPGYSRYPSFLVGQTRAEAMARSLRPLEGLDLFIANIDSQAGGGWAETTMIGTEKILYKYLNVPAPTWLDEHYYEDKIIRGTFIPTEENPDFYSLNQV